MLIFLSIEGEASYMAKPSTTAIVYLFSNIICHQIFSVPMNPIHYLDPLE
jgi:hypothetical protein